MVKLGLKYLGFLTLLPVLHFLIVTNSSCTRAGSNTPPAGAPSPSSQPTASAPASQPAKSPTTKPSPAMAPPKTFREAIAQARATDKAIYLKFTATWCGPCRIFERQVLSTPEGKEALKQVIYLPVDIDEHGDMAERFEITGVPTGVLVKPERSGQAVKIIDRHVGMLSISELIEFLSKKG